MEQKSEKPNLSFISANSRLPLTLKYRLQMNEISIKLLVRLKFMQSAQPGNELHYSFEVHT